MRVETDEELIAQLNDGRSQALDELYRRYARKLFVFCSTAMSSRQPEDMVHDVFTRVIEASGQFDSTKASFRSWVYRIARNRCVDLARRDARVRFGSLDDDVRSGAGREVVEAIAAEEGVEESALRAAVVAAVRRCIDELQNEDERQALVLFYLSDKVYREVGLIIGKSTSMAQKRVKLARERMRRCLARRGVEA